MATTITFDKTLCYYCVEPLRVGDHTFCLKRLETGTPTDRKDPVVANSIRVIKRIVGRFNAKMQKRKKTCLQCGETHYRKGPFCKTACTLKAGRDRAKGLPIGSSGAPRERNKVVA